MIGPLEALNRTTQDPGRAEHGGWGVTVASAPSEVTTTTSDDGTALAFQFLYLEPAMPTSALNSALSSSTQTSSATSAANAQSDAFRNADFLKIMLSELAHQDPLQPQETSKIVENMQKLQELANTQFTKFRADIGWGQQLLGKTVNVQQMMIGESEKQKLTNAGVRPDVGYGNHDGKVTAFRQVGETVYVSIGDYDYPIDNVKQVRPTVNDPDYLANLAGNLLGRNVGYRMDDGKAGQGKVTHVGYDTNGEVVLNIDGLAIPYRNMVQIAS